MFTVIPSPPDRANKNIPLLPVTCQKIMGRSVYKTFCFYLLVFLTGEKKSQP